MLPDELLAVTVALVVPLFARKDTPRNGPMTESAAMPATSTRFRTLADDCLIGRRSNISELSICTLSKTQLLPAPAQLQRVWASKQSGLTHKYFCQLCLVSYLSFDIYDIFYFHSIPPGAYTTKKMVYSLTLGSAFTGIPALRGD